MIELLICCVKQLVIYWSANFPYSNIESCNVCPDLHFIPIYGHAVSGHAVACHTVFGHAISGHAVSGHATSVRAFFVMPSLIKNF